MSNVTVKLDKRIRLISTALAATNHPEAAQQRKRHQPHHHARAMRKYLNDNEHSSHAAIQTLQELLDQGTPLEALYALAMQMSWPDLTLESFPRWVPSGWDLMLQSFYDKAELESHWATDEHEWEQAEKQATRVFDDVQFIEFLKPFVGEFEETLVFMPNLCYPADREIGIQVGKDLIAITPPPLAWGDSAPWPYDEESMVNHSYRAALTQFGRQLLTRYLRANADKMKGVTKKQIPVSEQFKALHPSWEDQFVSLFVAAAVAMYLEDYVSKAEAKSYILMEKKVRGMTILPGTISVMRRYLQEYGNKYHTLVDFLPVFPAQLRVAKKIVTL